MQSFADAKLVWKSEENYVPGAWGSQYFGQPERGQGSYGGVAVGDGKVYAYYTCQVKVPMDAAATNAAPEQTNAPPHVAWTKREDGVSVLSEVTPLADPAAMWKPSMPYQGPVRSGKVLCPWSDEREHDHKRLRGVKSLDRVLCLDATTGRTLWRASWPGVSFCLKAANHSTPCVADGVVVVQSGMFMIYALDAATGAMRWSNADTFAARKEAIADYAGMALRAISDVENALGAARTLSERDLLLQRVTADNQRALDLAQTSYRVGRTDLRAVQQQQLNVYDARLASLRVQSEQLAQRVNLDLALGGSFENRAMLEATAGPKQTTGLLDQP